MISVIVPCRNERRHIRALLDGILAQDTAGFECEVLIADGGSSDGTRDILAEYCGRDSRIRVLDNPSGTVSAGLNLAIREARGEIVLRMDAHTEYAPGYIRTCLETLERTGADNVGGPARTRAEGTLARAIAAAYHSPFSTGGARFHDTDYEGPVDTVPYGCWRKATLDRLGGFDEALVRNQDDELNLRLVRSGGTIWQSPRIVSWYRPRPSFSKLFLQYFQYGFWKVAVIRKHRIPASWRHLVPGAFVAANGMLALACAAAAAVRSAPVLGGAALAWLVLIGTYASACAIAAIRAASGEWRLIPALAAAFPVYHFSYGSGFLFGLACRSAGRPLRPRWFRWVTSLSR